MDRILLEEVFKDYKNIYDSILNAFYPSLGSTGFQERNLTVNFSKAYESAYEKDTVFSWFELQFGDKKNNHFDCLIINETRKEVFLIESKRFTNTTSKKSSVSLDIKRINDFVVGGMDDRFKRYSGYKVYGLILADVWTENNKKIDIYNNYKDESFFRKESLVANKRCQYNVLDFDIDGCDHNYALLSFVWEIR